MAVAVSTEERAFIRPDGKEKVNGSGRYTADLNLPGQLYARFRYADHPRARILSIDASRARSLPGVLAVLTHEDVPDLLYGHMVKDRRLFAKEEVRYEADVIAGIAAMSPRIAEQAASLIEVEYEVLTPVVDPEAALDPDAPLVHTAWQTYEASQAMGFEGNVVGRSTIVRGDVAAAMAESDVVVKSRYVADGAHGVPIEPRAIVAEWQGDRVTVWSSTQTPFGARSGVAFTLGIPESNVRIVVPLLGGGFGAKCDFHYEAHVAALARVAGRPVKLVFSRQEEFIAPDHRRESIAIELETGARRDGTILARRAKLVLDSGAYCGEGGFFAQMAAMHAVGPYVLGSVDIDSKLVYTNNQPSGSIRAPTAPHTCWAIEQHMDEVAAALDIDPVELRRRTLIEAGSESPTGQVFGPVGVKETLERAVELIGYGRELPENEAIGVACGWWPCFGIPAGAYVKLNADGTGTIITGAQENGSGAVMGLPILAAQVLGMKPDDFSILYQDTDAGPYDAGSSGSQTTFNNGRAVMEAAGEVREKLLEMASEQLEIDPLDLELIDGEVRVKGSPDKSVAIAELAASGAQILGKGSGQPPQSPACNPDSGCLGRIGMESFLEPQLITHAVHVRVDPETGVARVLRVAAAHDSGTILNPVGAEGQVRGGVVMGIGQALSEGMQLDESGRQLNPHLLDYKLVTSADAPPIEIAWVQTYAADGGPNGSKGIGEPPCVPTPGAVGNAIARALGRRVYRLPMTPERVWEASQ
jgi:CO/xanthine dehydrogenase Mo-binding subunit